MSMCCPPMPCCVGTVTKAPGDRLKVRIDMSEWIAATGGTIVLSGFSYSVWDIGANAAASPPPSGVGVIAGSETIEQNEDGLNAILAFGIEGGTDGNSYRIDATVTVRDCQGFDEVKEFCVLVQVAGIAR